MSIFGFKRWMHWSVGEWSALKRALATHAVVSEQVGGAGEIVCL